MPWTFAGTADIGGRTEQQDRFGLFALTGDNHLAVVADGMGGHEDGAAAAEIVIEVTRRFAEHEDPSNPRAFLERLCLEAHEGINAIGGRAVLGAGSTCVVLYVAGPEAYWVHVGDGRLYHFRGDRILGRTRDHSLVELMVQEGTLAECDAARHALQNQVYMRLGGEIEPQPDFDCLAVEPGDVFLLCSDGFWELIEPATMQRVLLEGGGVEESAARLMALARRRCGEHADNISIVLARWAAQGD